MKSEDDNTSDATIIHASFDGEKDVETIEGMQPTLYHVNCETNEIGDIIVLLFVKKLNLLQKTM